MSATLHTVTGLLLATVLLAGPAAAQESTAAATSAETSATPDIAPVPAAAKARVRIFGQNGQGITMYTDAACRNTYTDKVDVARSGARAIGSLFGGAPDNIALGMPETSTVRNMKSVLFSKPNYQEYAVAGGRPLIFDARVENTNDYRCDRELTLQFTAEPGQDYEVFMSTAGGICRLSANHVGADGSVQAQATTFPPQRCEAPVEAAPATPADSTGTSEAMTTVAADATALVAAAAVPDGNAVVAPAVAAVAPRDWTRTVGIMSTQGTGQDNNRYGDLALRLVSRGDTGKVVGLKLGVLALAVTGRAYVGRVDGFNKNNLRGDTIESVPSPAVVHMPDLLRAELAEFFRAHPDAIPVERRTVQASAGTWTLAYQKLAGSNVPYELRHQASIGFLLPKDGQTQTIVYCTDERLQAPLDEWQADDYAKVRAASQAFAERCVASFVAELPKVFPELAQPEQETAQSNEAQTVAATEQT
ncbi:MAG: hypothetical protein ACREPC_02375 [Stenotrophomonas sp.]|uniref:hypothetical protein n=1 Tax=Stenotrophomonas sp. TaxID=69392 RepID=UPI003D6D4DE0